MIGSPSRLRDPIEARELSLEVGVAFLADPVVLGDVQAVKAAPSSEHRNVPRSDALKVKVNGAPGILYVHPDGDVHLDETEPVVAERRQHGRSQVVGRSDPEVLHTSQSRAGALPDRCSTLSPSR